MTREAKMRRAKLITLLNLLSGALVFCHIWGLLRPGLGLTFLIGLAIGAAGLFHRWGIARCSLGFGTLGASCDAFTTTSIVIPTRPPSIMTTGRWPWVTCWRVNGWFPGPLPT